MKQDKIKSWDKKNDVLTLICEWKDCLNVYEDLPHFFSHITDHICNKDNANDLIYNDEITQKNYKCLWRNCVIEENKFSSLLTLLNHVNFHAYHQKLKSIGATLVYKNNLNKCRLDEMNRNALPDPIDVMCCEWKKCRESILNPENFFNHVNEHIDEYAGGNLPNGGCKCHWKYCSVKVRNKYRLRDHIRTHTHEKLCACPTCGTFFANATKLVDHIKRQAESPILSYQCSHCDKKFSTRRILRSHMGQHIYKYRCPFCNISCISPSSLRLHIRYKHMDDRPHQCPDCDYRSKTAIDLRKHLEIHKDSFLFCEFKGCLYKTRFLWRLSLHIKNSHQNVDKCKYVCDECGLKYRNGSNLSQHLKKKHDITLPEGHSRFSYKLHKDGFYHLQTIRYETIKMTEQEVERNNSSPALYDENCKGTESPSPNESSYLLETTETRTPLIDHNSKTTPGIASVSRSTRKKRLRGTSISSKRKGNCVASDYSIGEGQRMVGDSLEDSKRLSSTNDDCLILADFNSNFRASSSAEYSLLQADSCLSVIGSANVISDSFKNPKSEFLIRHCTDQAQEEYNLMQL